MLELKLLLQLVLALELAQLRTDARAGSGPDSSSETGAGSCSDLALL